ncbi:MAG: sodium-dependent transporter [Gammaproteobacteria bacterium]|nr:sodium-dependent transporter [Gammaproteobacteria bacterium]
MNNQTKVRWSSQLTFMMAAVGSAVGLANIYRFPYTAGVSGGGAFVLIYLGAVLLLALPLVIAELMVGRRGKAAPPQALRNVAAESGLSSRWGWMGVVLGGIGGMLALSFYSVVGGWTMAFTVEMATGAASGSVEQAKNLFGQLNANPWAVLTWFTIFIGATIVISARGIRGGVERAVKLMMPALLVILVLMVGYAMSVGEFQRAVDFLFTPDFSKVDASVFLAAAGQAFFSVSVGLTALVAYGSYIRRDTAIPQSALVIVGVDTVVALLAGLAIFPIIFAFGVEPDAGPGLVFITLPIVFAGMPGGGFFGALFFLLLLFAALTSSIGMLEAPVSWLAERTRLGRTGAALAAGGVSWSLGILAALSFNVLGDVHPLGGVPLFAGKTFFDLFDFMVVNLMMPLGGILIAIFVGWRIKGRFSRAELYGDRSTPWFGAWRFLLRWFAPVVLTGIFLDMLIQ